MILFGVKRLTLTVGAALALMLAIAIPPAHPSNAQTAPAGAQPQRWQIQVDNLSPAGHVWGFNAFYPDRFQAHAGDLVTFAVAGNPNAFHAVAMLAAGIAPEQGYPGFVFVDDDDDPPPLSATFFNSKPFFGAQPSTLCGRGGNAPCSYDAGGSLKSGALLNPPPAPASGKGNPSFTFQLDPKLNPGTYFFICLVHGPSMYGSVDVVPAAESVQAPDQLKADADRTYAADLDTLTALARGIQAPSVQTDLAGARSWKIAAGGGNPSTRLSVNEFGVHNLIIRTGDSVTWTNQSPAIVTHTVTGFAAQGETLNRLEPYQPVCGGPDPDQNGETGPDTFIAPGAGFMPDIWNDCPPWQQEDHLTSYAMPALPSGSTYTGGAVTSGILLDAGFVKSALGLGLPFASSYTLTFTQTGTYRYACMLHYGMTGSIEVIKTPTPTPSS